MGQTATGGLTVHQRGKPENNPSTITDIEGEPPTVDQLANQIWQTGSRVADQLPDNGMVTFTTVTEGKLFNQLWVIRFGTSSGRPVFLEVHKVVIEKSASKEDQEAIANTIGTPEERVFIKAGRRYIASMAEFPPYLPSRHPISFFAKTEMARSGKSPRKEKSRMGESLYL